MSTQTEEVVAEIEVDKAGEKADEFIETVAPAIAHREQRILYGDFERVYTQKPLSFFAKFEFVRLVGRAIDEAMSGDNPLTVSNLLGAPNVNMGDLSTADSFVRALARLAEYAPDLLKDVYMIALNVPRHERPLVGEILEMPHDDETGEGGLSDEDGLAVMETFIDQNAKVLADFFRERLVELAKRAKAAVEQTQDSSKPSKRTQRTTPKR